jgi:L-threonylcarbamoyladenylate synthase
MQSSANLSGRPEARRLRDVPQALRRGVDLELDGGELPGIASTVLDLSEYETDGRWRVAREGPVGRQQLRRALS